MDKSGIQKFNCTGDSTNVGPQWKRWLNRFEIYADSKGLIVVAGKDDNKQRRRALLLHLAGEDVQDIFETLPDTGEAKDYQKAVNALNKHFIPKKNTAHARHLFKNTIIHPGESVSQYFTRLKTVVKDCDFGGDENNQIRDQILFHCQSDYLQRRLLEVGDDLTLEKTLDLARDCEQVEQRLSALRGNNSSSTSETANYTRSSTSSSSGRHTTQKQQKHHAESSKTSKKRQCYRCGREGHFGRDPECPARGKECTKCHLKDHFANMCKTDLSKRRVNAVADDASDRTNDNPYAFSVNQKGAPKATFNVGGVPLDLLIDSGSSANVIDKQTWDILKVNNISCTSRVVIGKTLQTYATKEPLQVIGCFTCEVERNDNQATAEFCVVQGAGNTPLLSRSTAEELGVLKIEINAVHESDMKDSIMRKYPDVFQGIGKLKGRQVKLHVDESVTPIAQPLRRTPFNLREQVEAKITELIDNDIIEPVENATPWVNPVVIVPKPSGEIRLCLDMRRANEAIERVRFPIPTVDEILQELNGSKVFSKLDLKWGYHQIELDEKSRDITTFSVHNGLYRYKRLFFGVNSATEQYQHEVQRAISGIEGARNISDDIIVHGPDQETHDKRLEAVVNRLAQSGLTLNSEKCEFNMAELTFMGLLLSEKGIGTTDARVKAVREFREPQNVSEVRSFLGLVTYSSRFIPDFATKSEPLRRLTKKDVKFEFGEEQKHAFELLKDAVADSGTLAYYKRDAPTRVICDASPVGLGAALVQKQNEKWTVVAYASKSLSDCETRYSQNEKEALAIVWSCEKFHPYIFATKFEILSDHEALKVLYGPRSRPSARIERWVLRMQQYDFKVVHIPGCDNIADALSRLLKTETDCSSYDSDDVYIRFVATSSVPVAMNIKDIEFESGQDDELTQLRDCVNNSRNMKDFPNEYRRIASELCCIGKIVLRGTRIVMPKALRPNVLRIAHEGHLGIVATKQRLRTKVWWPSMDKEAERHCQACHGCQLVSRPDPPEPIRSTPLPEGPWKELAVDLLGPLPTGESLLVVVDYFSRYYEIVVLRDTKAEIVIDKLDEIFSRFGYPVSIRSDNGPQFKSEKYSQYLESINVKAVLTTPKWAQANGEVERQNHSIMKRIKIACAEGTPWKLELRKYLLAYRAIPHSTTGKSPAELMFGRKLRTKMPDFTWEEENVNTDQEVIDKDNENKAMSKFYADTRRNAQHSEIDLGDKVLVKRDQMCKTDTPFKVQPYTVVKKTGGSVTVESPDGVSYERNTSHLKKFEEPDNDNQVLIPPQTPPPPLPETPTRIPAPASEMPSRPKRNAKPPIRFQDYVTTLEFDN